MMLPGLFNPSNYTKTIYGYSWAQTATITAGTGGNVFGCDISSDGQSLVVGQGAQTTGGFIYTSNNGGTSWTSRFGNNTASHLTNWSDVKISANGNDIVALSSALTLSDQNILYKSSDKGVSWSLRTLPSLQPNNQFLLIGASADRTKMVIGDNGYGYGTNSFMWQSLDSGNTWLVINNSGSHWWYGACISDDGTVIAGNDDGVGGPTNAMRVSIDSGVTWIAKTGNTNTNWRGMTCSSTGKFMYSVGGGNATTGNGYINVSNDYGNNWSAITITNLNRFSTISCSDDGKIVIAGSGATTNATTIGYPFLSLDYGTTWSSLASLGAGAYYRSSITRNGKYIIITDKWNNKVWVGTAQY